MTESLNAADMKPRIYVACLAAYNAGYLHGAWIDVDQDADAIENEMRNMLSKSPLPLAEEWAIHDYEGFGALRLSEWESLERVAAIASGISKHGLAFAGWLSYGSSHDPFDVERCEDSYRGEWESLRAYAEDFAESIGLYDVADKTGSSYIVVDIGMLERDLDIEMYTIASESGVYVFDPQS
jgi:antirestriction protein